MHLLTQSALLRALGWSLLNSLWQMAFLWLVYAVFTHIFRRASAGVRHGLALLLLGAGTIWTIISFFTAFFNADPILSAYQLGELLFPGAAGVTSFLQRGRQFIDEALPWCSTLYLLTLFFLFVRYGKQYLYSKDLTRTGLSKPSPELRLFAEHTGQRMGIRRDVRLWFSTLVEGPVTLGFIKPIILIPLATVSNLSPQQVEALILHELAHIRKQDYLLNLWIAALEVLFFFNPFSRLLIRSIQKEREHRCDDLVLQFKYDPHTYVSALMALAKSIQGSPRLVLAATGSNDRLLLQRVKRILKLKSAPEPLRSKSLIFLLFTLFITGMTLSRPAAFDRRNHTMEAPALAAAAPSPNEPRIIPDKTSELVTFVSIHTTPQLRQDTPPVKEPHKKKAHSSDSYETDLEYTNVDQSAAPETGDDDSDLAGYAATVQTYKRDYSITAHTTIGSQKVDVAPTPSPYVPNSSFSFQRVQDSTYPGEQTVYMQQMATRQVEQAILKMRKELQWQLKILQQSSSKDVPDLKQKQQIIIEQLKLQQLYLEKQQQLQKRLERVGKKRVIVVI